MKKYLTTQEFNTLNTTTLYPGAEFVITDVSGYPVKRWNGAEFLDRAQYATDASGNNVLVGPDGGYVSPLPVVHWNSLPTPSNANLGQGILLLM